LGPRALEMLRAPRYLNPALPARQSFVHAVVFLFQYIANMFELQRNAASEFLPTDNIATLFCLTRVLML